MDEGIFSLLAPSSGPSAATIVGTGDSAQEDFSYVVEEAKVREGAWINKGQLLFVLRPLPPAKGLVRLRAEVSGTVLSFVGKSLRPIRPGSELCRITRTECQHKTLMKNMCADCGADLQNLEDGELRSANQKTSIAIVHSIPELKVSSDEAVNLGKEDERRLLRDRRLVLLVDLDQTLIHTTNEDIRPNIKDVHHFQLYGPKSPWYHTRIRPGTAEFLSKIAQLYELHICTFGARLYAHTVAGFLDQDSRFFSHRILSRDECFDSRSKTANLASLFPCGDHMVCIIDDREDVWNYAPNLVHVKPYNFFKNTGDINAPPGAQIPAGPISNKSKAVVATTTTSSSSSSSTPPVPGGKTAPTPANSEAPGGQESVVSRARDLRSDSATKIASETNSERPPDKVDKVERRDSIDMPFIEAAEGAAKKVDSDATSVVSEDLEMSEDSSSSSGSNGSSSSSENSSSNSSKGSKKGSKGSPPKGASGQDEPKAVPESPASGDKAPAATVTTLTPSKSDGPENARTSNGGGGGLEKPAASTDDDNLAAAQPKGTEVDDKDGEDDSEDSSSAKSGMTNDDVGAGGKDENDAKNLADDLVEVEDTDDYLLYLEDILKSIHAAYYDLYDRGAAVRQDGEPRVPDLKRVIPSVKRKALAGTSLVFSGVVPTQVPLEKSKPFFVARSLGAKVSDRISGETTHLVAARVGTAKVNDARKHARNVHIVTPDWLWCCAERWERIDERLYPLCTTSRVTLKPPPHCSSPEDNAAERLQQTSVAHLRPDGPLVEEEEDQEDEDELLSGRVRRIGGAAIRQGSKERHYSTSSSLPETMNPFLAFSGDELKDMDDEVEDILSGENTSSSSSSSNGSSNGSSEGSHATPGKGPDRGRVDVGDDDESKKSKVDDEADPEVQVRLSESSSSGSEGGPEGPVGQKKGRKRKLEEGREDDDDNDDDDDDDDPMDRFEHGQDLPEDYEIEEQSDDDDDDDDDDDGGGGEEEDDRSMAEALEREFFGDCNSSSNF